MEAVKNEVSVEDFVTVVSQSKTESFVTVLSIGKGNYGVSKIDEDHWDEEVEVYRLPGERLGFGLKFEGGNKTTEKVRRLFVQSCAEQSPASRVKCSWGSLSEGDEILSIDGVPVMHMSRLDCVQRFKESQLIIKLLVRRQGALKLQVIDEKKASKIDESKISRELSPVPPPVPPRKSRQARGSADGHANPIPVKRQNGSVNSQCRANHLISVDVPNLDVTSNTNSLKEKSPSSFKFDKEPPKAMARFDIISQNRSSTYESTSIDTSSLISPVADKLLNLKNLSTSEPVNEASLLEIREPFNQNSHNHPDYLLKHFALSEVVTNSATRDETFVEKKNPSNLLSIDETITLKPPINFQDTPLSYGHESRPIVFYTPDLAADSTTHFRPILDDPSLVQSVDENVAFGVTEEPSHSINKTEFQKKLALPLPAENHINRILVEQTNRIEIKVKDTSDHYETPIVPPLRKDSKLRRRRLPPPPPPPLPPLSRPTALKRGQGQNSEFSQLKKHQNEEISHDEINTSDNNNNNHNTNNENNNKNSTKDEVLLNNDGLIEQKKSQNIDKELQKNKTVEISRLQINNENKILPILSCKVIDSIHDDDKCIENLISDDIVPESRNSFVNLLLSSSSDNNDKKKREEWEEANNSDENTLIKKQQIQKIGKKKFDTLEDDINISESNGRITYQLDDSDENEEVATRFDSEGEEDDDNGNDYYWQSNLETIGEDEEGEEEEGYTSMNIESKRKQQEIKPVKKTIALNTSIVPEKNQLNTGAVNGRMENCGGGQRLPPDGDEFPAAYQEFSPTVVVDDTYLGNKKAVIQTNDQHVLSHPSYIITNNKDVPIKNTEHGNSNDLHSMKFIKVYSARDNTDSVVSSKKMFNIDIHDLRESEIETVGGIIHPVLPEIPVNTLFGGDCFEICPPPLPLTGPPRTEKPILFSKSLSTDNAFEKFPFHGNSRRQDDKSEKSVKDKIAMFSSQSSLESPLFPNISVTNINTSTKSLSKQMPSENFFNEDHQNQHQKQQYQNCPMQQMVKDRKSSVLDYTDSSENFSLIESESTGQNIGLQPSLPRTLPPEDPLNLLPMHDNRCDAPLITQKLNLNDNPKILSSSSSQQPIKKSSNNLIRATSFSGGISHNSEMTSTINNGRIPRTSSFASTLERNGDVIIRTSLNQLIEQRKKGISKLRGLVIPEKVDIPVDQAIIDLPEIKPRDSVLAQQKGLFQDKWGSQNSLASNISTQSMPIKTTLFKIPTPQILPKYSPAFKRKSLTVCNSSNTPSNKPSILLTSTSSTTVTASESPKSLESICSPTRSDYSFEFTSNHSPEGPRPRPRFSHRKNRGDYDDSDNDSAVSSSQSSISRGFSPPSSPVPSERSNLSLSEKSYRVILEIPTNHSLNERSSNLSKTTIYPTERIHFDSNRLTSSNSSSCSSSNPRSPPLSSDHNSRYRGIPQRQLLKRSSSTETNCSTSSTLTSGSQASSESLSRRVLKPQSVEAINRKNILASARCRSGRDLNGSPLIQRKFTGQEKIFDNTERNKHCSPICKIDGIDRIDISNAKIAYAHDIVDYPVEKKIETMKQERLPLKRSLSYATSSSKPDVLQVSNSLRNWVQSETKTYALLDECDKLPPKLKQTRILRTRSALSLGEINSTSFMIKSPSIDTINNDKKEIITTNHNDLIMTLTTRSRSRAPINFKESMVSRSESQMSIEDILIGKNYSKTSSVRSESHLNHPISKRTQFESPSNESPLLSVDDKLFVSKIPTYRTKIEVTDDSTKDSNERSKISKISSQQLLSRRSASVTDMKKAVEKSNSTIGTQQVQSVHTRFPSFDGSTDNVDIQPVSSGMMEHEKFNSEQFGSISSLASSTSMISQQELAQLVEDASFEEASHDIIVIILHKENPSGSVGIILAGGVDCEAKEITVHRVLSHSIADRDGRLQRGDRILSINGKSTRGLDHKESLAVLKQPRSEVVLVVSRARMNGLECTTMEEGAKLRSRTQSVETVVEGFEVDTAWGPVTKVTVLKNGAGLGFSLEGGRDSPLGDRPLLIKKLFAGGAAEKTNSLMAGDQLLEVNNIDVTRMSRIEAWSLMKKLQDGGVSLLVRHSATKSS